MRKAVRDINGIQVCEEDAAVPSAFGEQDAGTAALTFTLWTVEGYFVRAFPTLLEALDYAKATAGSPFDAAANEGIERLVRFADVADPASHLAITDRVGIVLHTVADFDAALKCITADIAKAAIDRGSSGLDPASGMR